MAATTAGRGSGHRGGELPRVQDEDEGEDVSFVFILAKRYLGRDGLCWAGAVGPVVGLCWWAARPGKLQVGFSSLFFFCFYFLFSIFYFEFNFECFSILQMLYMLIPFGCCVMTITPIFHLKQVFYIALYYILVFYSK
jgi:hypothetical protein